MHIICTFDNVFLSGEKVQKVQEGSDSNIESLPKVTGSVERLPYDHGHNLRGERPPADQARLQPAPGGGEGLQAALQGVDHLPASPDPMFCDARQQRQD